MRGHTVPLGLICTPKWLAVAFAEQWPHLRRPQEGCIWLHSPSLQIRDCPCIACVGVSSSRHLHCLPFIAVFSV